MQEQSSFDPNEVTKPHLFDSKSATTTSVGEATEPLVDTDSAGNEWLTPEKGEGPDIQSGDSSTASEAIDSLDEETQDPFQKKDTPNPVATATFDQVTPISQPTERQLSNPEPDALQEPTIAGEPVPIQPRITEAHPALTEETVKNLGSNEVGVVETTDYNTTQYTGQLKENQPMLIGKNSQPNGQENYVISFNQQLTDISTEQLQIMWRKDNEFGPNKILIYDNRPYDPDAAVNYQDTKLDGNVITRSGAAWTEIQQGQSLELNGIWFDIKVCDSESGVIKLEQVTMSDCLPLIFEKGPWEQIELVDKLGLRKPDSWLAKFDLGTDSPDAKEIRLANLLKLLSEIWKKWVTNPELNDVNKEQVLDLFSGETLEDDLDILHKKIGDNRKLKGKPIVSSLRDAIISKNPQAGEA